jgi:hypothetical protein
VAAGDHSLAEAVVTGRAGDALAEAEDLNQVFVGDAGSVVTGLEPSGFGLESDKVAEFRRSFLRLDWADDPASVTHVTPGVTTSATAIERQTEAVAAVADAVE